MSEIAGIQIPPEEMTDKNAKLFAAGSPAKVKKEKQPALNTSQAQDTANALNSVAALFSSIPGMGSLGINN